MHDGGSDEGVDMVDKAGQWRRCWRGEVPCVGRSGRGASGCSRKKVLRGFCSSLSVALSIGVSLSYNTHLSYSGP